MPKTSQDFVPTYRKHKSTGQAVVTLNDRDHYLGKWKSKESKAEYDRVIGEWLARGRQLPVSGEALTVNEVLLAYVRHATVRYGGKSKELYSTTDVTCIVRALFGTEPATDFGPRRLRAVREKMVEKGWCRNHVNQQVQRLRRIWKWAAAEELVPGEVWHSLQAVDGIRRGTVGIRESDPVKPVPEAFVEAVLPRVPPPVKAMIDLQLLTAMRPGEACIMRGVDLETSGRVWTYRPAHHKTMNHGHERTIFLGPRAQEVLKPWLRADLEGYLFQPKEAREQRHLRLRQQRKSPVQPSQVNRKRRHAKRLPGEHYTTGSYSGAIQRACIRADVPTWTPNRLRHNAATALRKEHGIELARIILGHATAFTTEIYAEADRAQAMEVIARIG